jgi:hypothetical protein
MTVAMSTSEVGGKFQLTTVSAAGAGSAGGAQPNPRRAATTRAGARGTAEAQRPVARTLLSSSTPPGLGAGGGGTFVMRLTAPHLNIAALLAAAGLGCVAVGSEGQAGPPEPTEATASGAAGPTVEQLRRASRPIGEADQPMADLPDGAAELRLPEDADERWQAGKEMGRALKRDFEDAWRRHRPVAEVGPEAAPAPGGQDRGSAPVPVEMGISVGPRPEVVICKNGGVSSEQVRRPQARMEVDYRSATLLAPEGGWSEEATAATRRGEPPTWLASVLGRSFSRRADACVRRYGWDLEQHGSVSIALDIEADGDIGLVANATASLADAGPAAPALDDTLACIIREMRRLRFRAPPGGQIAVRGVRLHPVAD